MKLKIKLKLFATLQEFTPPSADNFMINPGTSVSDLLDQINVPREKAKLRLHTYQVSVDKALKAMVVQGCLQGTFNRVAA